MESDPSEKSPSTEKVPKSDPVPKPRRRWLKVAVVLLVVLPALLLLGGRIALSKALTPERLVTELETQLNVRASIESIDVSLLSAPARIRLEKVQIGHRDKVANDAEALADRSAIPTPVLEFAYVEMEVSLWSMLGGEVKVQRVTLGPGAVLGRVRGNGELTLSSLFEEPQIVNGKPNPKLNKTESVSSSGATTESDDGPSFSFTGLEEFAWEKTQMKIEINGRKTLLDGTDLTLRVGEVTVGEEARLVEQTIPLKITGVLRVVEAKTEFQQARFELDGDADLMVDAEGELSEVKLALRFGQGSTISVLPTLEKLKEKVRKFRDTGIDIEDRLADSVTFPEGGSLLTAHLKEGVITTSEPFHAQYGDFDVFALSGGYVNIGNNDHFFDLRLPANQELSDYVMGQLRDKAGMIPTEKTRDQFLADVQESLYRDGLVELRATSKNDVSDPDVDITNDLPKPEKYLRGMLDELGVGGAEQEQLEEVGKSLLEGLFKK